MSKDFEDKLFGTLDSMRYGSLNNIDFKMSDVKGHLAAIEGALGRNGMAGNVYAIRQTLDQIAAGSGGGSTGGSTGGSGNSEQYLKDMSEQIGYMSEDVLSIRRALESSGNGSGDGSGDSIDYSQMPGSDSNPLSVKEAKYTSHCSGENCFFDIAATQKTLDDAKKSLSDKQSDISKEVQDIFAFQLSGSAGVIDCFDLFSHNGKNYQVCPPSKEYWATLAAMMMFIFYFIALLVIFRR